MLPKLFAMVAQATLPAQLESEMVITNVPIRWMEKRGLEGLRCRSKAETIWHWNTDLLSPKPYKTIRLCCFNISFLGSNLADFIRISCQPCGYYILVASVDFLPDSWV